MIQQLYYKDIKMGDNIITMLSAGGTEVSINKCNIKRYELFGYKQVTGSGVVDNPKREKDTKLKSKIGDLKHGKS